MNTQSKLKNFSIQIGLLVLCLIGSTSLMARGGGGNFGGGGGNFGGHGGGFQGGNFQGHGGWNNNVNHYDGYHYNNNNYYDHNYDNPGYDAGNVIVVPGGDDASCDSQQVCNSYGQCWTEQNCD